MKKEYLVSVVIPIYNAQNFLDKCLDSVLKQTYTNLEVILVNDGSTDNSFELCKNYEEADSRIKLIDCQNGGPSKARNIGIENVTGEFIFFIDADDWIEQTTIEQLIEEYDINKTDLIISDYRKITKYGIVTSGHENYFHNDTVLDSYEILEYVRTYLTKPNRFPLFVYSWGRLFKSSIIKDNDIRFDESLRTYEDVNFNFEYLKYTQNLSFLLNKAFYFHLLHDNFTSHSLKIFDKPENLLGYQKAFENLKRYIDTFNLNIDNEIEHAFTSYTVIQLVRMCGQICPQNRQIIYDAVTKVVKDPNVRNKLKYYKPTAGDSKIVPHLIKFRLVMPILYVCQYKAKKRYKGK